MTGEKCRKLAQDHKMNIQGNSVNVVLNAVTTFRYTPTGRIYMDHQVPEFEGDQYRAARQVVGALLTLKEVFISLQAVTFSVS